MDFYIDKDKMAERAFNERVNLTKSLYDKENKIKDSLTYDVDLSDYYADLGDIYRNAEKRRNEITQRYKDFGNGYLYTTGGNVIELDPYSFEDRVKFADTMSSLYPEYSRQYFLDSGEDWIYQTTGQKVNVKSFNEHLANTWNMAWANVADSLDTFTSYLGKPFMNEANYELQKAQSKERTSNSESRYDKSKVDRIYDGFIQKIVSGGVAQAPQFIASLASGLAGYGIGTIATKLGATLLTGHNISKATRLAGTFLFSALNEAGGAMSDLRDMGFSDNAVIGAGLGIGLATGVLEAWGSDKILSPIEDTANKIFQIKDGDLVRLGKDNFIEYIKKRGVDTLKDIGKGEITEVAEEELEYLASLPIYFIANEYEKKYGNGGVSNEELGLTVDNVLKNIKETAIETAYSTPLMTLSSNVISTGLDVSVFRNRQSFTPYSYMNSEGATNVVPTDNIVLNYTVDNSLKEETASPIPVRVVGNNVFVEGVLTSKQNEAIRNHKVVFIKEDETTTANMNKDEAYRIVEEKRKSPKMSISPSSVNEVLFYSGLEDRIDSYTFIDKQGKFSDSFDDKNTTFMALKFKNGQEELVEISKDNADSDIYETLLLKRGGFTDEEIVVILAKREIENLRKEDNGEVINESKRDKFIKKAKAKLSDLKKAIFEKKSKKKNAETESNTNTDSTNTDSTDVKEGVQEKETTATEEVATPTQEETTAKEEVVTTNQEETEPVTKKKVNKLDEQVKEKLNEEKANEEVVTEEQEGIDLLSEILAESDKESEVDTGIVETIEEEPIENEVSNDVSTDDVVNTEEVEDTTQEVVKPVEVTEEQPVVVEEQKKEEPKKLTYRRYKDFAVSSKIKEGKAGLSYTYEDKKGNVTDKANAYAIAIQESDGSISRVIVKGLKDSSINLLEKYASNDNETASMIVGMKEAVKKLETLEELGVEVIHENPKTVSETESTQLDFLDILDSEEEQTSTEENVQVVEENTEAVDTEEKPAEENVAEPVIEQPTVTEETNEEIKEEPKEVEKEEKVETPIEEGEITLSAVNDLSKELRELKTKKDKADKISTATVGIANALKTVPYFEKYIKYDENKKVSNALYRNGAETFDIAKQAVIDYVKTNGSKKSLSEIISGVIANTENKSTAMMRLAFNLFGIDSTSYEFNFEVLGEEDSPISVFSKDFMQLERMLNLYLNGQEIDGFSLEQVCLDVKQLRAIKEAYDKTIETYPTENINEKAVVVQNEAIKEEKESIIPPTTIDNQIKEIERVEEKQEKKKSKKTKKETKIEKTSTEETNNALEEQVDTDVDIATTPSPYSTIRGALEEGVTEENLANIKNQLLKLDPKRGSNSFVDMLYNLHSKLFTTRGASKLANYSLDSNNVSLADTFRVAKLLAKTQYFGDDARMTTSLSVLEELTAYSIASMYDEYCSDKANVTPNNFFTAILQYLNGGGEINSIMNKPNVDVSLEGLISYLNKKTKQLAKTTNAPALDINTLYTEDYDKSRRRKYKNEVKKALEENMPTLTDEELDVLASLYSAVYPNYSIEKLTNNIIKNIPVDELTVIKGATSNIAQTIFLGDNADVSTVVHELFHAVFSVRNDYANSLVTEIKATLDDENRKAKFGLFLSEHKEVWHNERLGLKSDQIVERFENHLKDYDGTNVSVDFEEDLARLWLSYVSSNTNHKNLDSGIRKILNKLKTVLSDFFHYLKNTFELDSGIANAFDNLMFDSTSSVLEQEYRKKVQSKDFALDDIHFQKADSELAERLDKEKTFKAYRAMQLIDGKLYPPMATVVNGSRVQSSEFGQWYVADENPSIAVPDIDKKTGKQKINKKTGRPSWLFSLDKGGKDIFGKKLTTITAGYNPYWHASFSPLNDQFTSAYKRPNIVTVEVEIPESELTSGYWAEKAKDPVGLTDWHSGVVSSKLAQYGKTRKVVLSRYNKLVRIVPDSEVAQSIKSILEGTDIVIPSNVVTPSLLAELKAIDVPIQDTTSDLLRFQIGSLNIDGYIATKDIAQGNNKDFITYQQFVDVVYNGLICNAEATNSKSINLLYSLYAKYGNIPQGVESEIMQGMIDEGIFKGFKTTLKNDDTETGYSDTVIRVFRMLCATNDDYATNYIKIKNLLSDFKNGNDKQKALTNILGYLYGSISTEDDGTMFYTDSGLLNSFSYDDMFDDKESVAFNIFNQLEDYQFNLYDVETILKPTNTQQGFCVANYSEGKLGDFEVNTKDFKKLTNYTNPSSKEVKTLIRLLEALSNSKHSKENDIFYNLSSVPKSYGSANGNIFSGALIDLCNIKHNEEIFTEAYNSEEIENNQDKGRSIIYENTDYLYLAVAQSNLYMAQIENLQEQKINGKFLLNSTRELLNATTRAVKDNVYNGKLSVNTPTEFIEKTEKEVKEKVKKATKKEEKTKAFQENVSKTLAVTQEVVKTLEKTVKNINVEEQKENASTTKGGEKAVKNTVTALTHAKTLINDKITEYNTLFKEKDDLFYESTFKKVFNSNNIKEFNKIEKELQRRLEKLNSLMNEALIISQNETKSDRSLKNVINYINKTIDFVSEKCMSKYNPLLQLLDEEANKAQLQKEGLEALEEKLQSYGLATHLRNTRKAFKELSKGNNKPVANKLGDIYSIFQTRQVKRDSDKNITGFKGESHKGKSLSFTGLFTEQDKLEGSETNMLEDAMDFIRFFANHDMIVIDPQDKSKFYVNKQMSDLTIKELAEFYDLARKVANNGEMKIKLEAEELKKSTERFASAVNNEIKALGKERNDIDYEDFVTCLGLGSAGDGTKKSFKDIARIAGTKSLSDFEILSVKYRNRFPLLYTFIFGGEYSFRDDNGEVHGVWGGINGGMERVNAWYSKRSKDTVKALVDFFSSTRYAEYKQLNIDNIERDLPMICSSWKTTLENVQYEDGGDIDSTYIERNHCTVDELGNITPNKNWEAVYDYLFNLDYEIKNTQLKIKNTNTRIGNLQSKRSEVYEDFEKRTEIDRKIEKAKETLEKQYKKLDDLKKTGKRPKGYHNVNLYTTQQLIGIYMIARQEGGLKHLIYNAETINNPNAQIGNNLTVGEVVWVMEQIENNEDYKPLKNFIDVMGSEISSRIDAIKKKKLELTGIALDEIDYYFTFLGEERVDTYTQAYDMPFDISLNAEKKDSRSAVNDSFTKDRTTNTRALSLDAIGNFFRSLYKQEYYIGMASEVKAIQNLANSNDFKRSMEYYYGQEEGDLNVAQLQKYANNLAKRPKVDETVVGEIARFITGNTARASLSFSITTVLQQFPTVLYCATEMGIQKTMEYVTEYFSDMKANAMWVYGNSSQMKERATSYQILGKQREFTNKKLQKVDSALSTVSSIGTKWLNEVDTHIANAMWYAYYYNELEKNMKNSKLSIEEIESISKLEATQKVMDISPSVSAKDNSNAFNNKSSLLRQLLLFQNQPSKMFYMLVNSFADKDLTKNGWDNFTRVAGITAVIVALSMVIKGNALPSTSDDDDKESYFVKLTKEFAGELFNLVPVVGSSLGEIFTGASYYDSTIITTIANLYKVLNKDRDDRTDNQLSNAFAYFVSAVGEMAGAPANAFNKVYRFVRDGFNFGQLYNYKLGEYLKDEGFLWL